MPSVLGTPESVVMLLLPRAQSTRANTVPFFGMKSKTPKADVTSIFVLGAEVPESISLWTNWRPPRKSLPR